MKVRYSKRALVQLEDIYLYISQFNPRAAGQVVARIEELCARLAEFPGMGTKTDQENVRVLPVVRYPYLVYYAVQADRDEVRILRIRHGRRRPLQSGEI
jgi:toxin ParE1/3/4